MDPQEIFDKLKDDFIRNQIPISNDFIINELHYMNSVTALGKTKKEKGFYYIYFSRYAMENEELIKKILAHELVHTIPGCMNHGPIFHRYGNMVQAKLGIPISTRASEEDTYQSGVARVKQEKAKYKIECEKCGKIIYRQKKSRLVLRPEKYRCTCGGKLRLFHI
ncbi:MAG: hypothetical protein PUH88_05920 [Lachnospiraceae bacterium]|nr:hypothetical protein [Lachnospiraceae bacterium]